MDAAGYAKLGRVMSDSGKRWGIPLRVGVVSGCTVTRSGIVTHQMLGACGGGDVTSAVPAPLAPAVVSGTHATHGDDPSSPSNVHLTVNAVGCTYTERDVPFSTCRDQLPGPWDWPHHD